MVQVEQDNSQVWEFNFNNWTLEEVIQFERATSLEDRLPVMATAIVRTPFDYDITERANWKKISVFQWAELQRRFADALKKIF